MPVIINASPTNGLVQTADGSGIVKVQSNGVTTNALAWVNFNGTGTVAIRSSYNVSSITDNGTGIYTVNFATALSDANYAWTGSAEGQSGMGVGAYPLIVSQYYPTIPTTSALAVGVLTTTSNLFADSRYVDIAVFGN
jgi:hypothetical protein